jgi:hypothetical protein
VIAAAHERLEMLPPVVANPEQVRKRIAPSEEGCQEFALVGCIPLSIYLVNFCKKESIMKSIRG